MKIVKGLFVVVFGAIVYADGEAIVRERLDVDPLNAGVYLRQSSDQLDLRAFSSTGDSILAFDTGDI